MAHSRIFSMTIIVLLALGGGACLVPFLGMEKAKDDAVTTGEKQFPPVAKAMGAPLVRPIPTAVAQLAKDGQLRVFPGKVQANRRAELSFSVGGKLVELNAREGCRVKQGDVLARLDQRDFRHGREAARARFLQAERNMAKYGKLHQQKVVTKTQFDDIRTAYDIALADLNICEKALADTTLHAPFDGIVVTRHIENYSSIKKEQPVLSLQDISGIEVVIQVPERLIARGGANGLHRLRVRFDADPTPDRWFNATVREFSVESDRATRTYDVVVAVAPPSDMRVFPGMTASVDALVNEDDASLEKQEAPSIVRVPLEAVWKGVDGFSYVWVVAPGGGPAAKKHVEIASLRGGCAEIQSGLEPGAFVAVAGVHALRANVLVRPQTSREGGLEE